MAHSLFSLFKYADLQAIVYEPYVSYMLRKNGGKETNMQNHADYNARE